MTNLSFLMMKERQGRKSGVLNITIGGKQIIHVGSSLALYEKGLINVSEEYNKSIPFINRMVNDARNLMLGQKKLILIRSQTGKPLATFVGDKVTYFSTDVDKSTGIIIDGKLLFIYRCDYTIYDLDLLQ